MASKPKQTWQELIDHAAFVGFSVQYSEEAEGWYYVTPARPRRPSQELGTYADSRAAWRAAAFEAHRLAL
jgi:hypothetical protein